MPSLLAIISPSLFKQDGSVVIAAVALIGSGSLRLTSFVAEQPLVSVMVTV